MLCLPVVFVAISLALEELSHYGLKGPLLQATQQPQISSANDWFSPGTFIEQSMYWRGCLRSREQ